MTTEAVSYSPYDKEMFKHTMLLAHEAAFRQQVYELHRVYRIQIDLVKHYQNKEMHICPRQEYASQRNSPSQVSLHGANTIVAGAVNNEKGHFRKFLREGSVESSPNGFASDGAALHNKEGMFDLECGADNYFEDDGASDGKPIDFLGVSSDTKHQSDGGITIARAEGLGRFGHNNSSRIKQDEKPLIDKGKHASNISFLAPRYIETDPLKTFDVADGRSGNSNQSIYHCTNNSTRWFFRSPLEASALSHFSRQVMHVKCIV